MPEEDLVEVKFRLYDGSDIGPFRVAPATTVANLKERIIADWPKDNKVTPKVANDVKIISAGKVLENSRTAGQCRMTFCELQKGVITMHVVVQPTVAKTKTEQFVECLSALLMLCVFIAVVTSFECDLVDEKKIDESERKSICSCSIL